MSVQFEEEKNFNEVFYKESSKGGSKMTEWMIKKGIVKTEKEAKIFSIVIAVICFALAIFIIIK